MNKLFLLLFLLLGLNLSAIERIAADAEEISVFGCRYSFLKDGALHFPRFQPEIAKLKRSEIGFNMQKALTTSGVRLSFKSNSRKITLLFKLPEGGENRGSEFALFINGKWHKDWSFKRKDGPQLSLVIDNDSAETRTFEITLPSFSNPLFKGMEIDDGSKIEKVSSKQKTYVAIGDSITHGVGQGSATHKTYPFLLARQLKADYYNLAVGGGKISLPVAKQLQDWKKIDLMTVLIGYNDWCSEGKTAAIYKKKYREFLQLVRKNHPETKIFCISMLYTKSLKSKKTGLPLQPFRQALYELVAELRQAGDKNIFLVKGENISSQKNLRTDNPSDPVHLGIEGAKLFAEALHKEIVKIIER